MKKYYLMYFFNGKMNLISHTKYNDIVQIDNMTFNKTKSEFINSLGYAKDLSNNDLFIVEVKKDSNNEYIINFHDVLFKQNQERLNLTIQKNILIKLNDTVNKTVTPMVIDDSYLNLLLTKSLSDGKLKKYLISKESIMPFKLKEYFKKLDNFNYLFYYYKFKEKLGNYSDFRKFMTSYIKYYDHDLTRANVPNFDLNVPFNGYIFDLDDNEYYTSYEAFMINNDHEYEQQKLKEITYLDEIKAKPFYDAKINEAYISGGVKEVYHQFDTDYIYSLPDEDLLKLGILTDHEYLKRNPISRKNNKP